MENQTKKKMANEMDAGIIFGVILYYSSGSFIWGYYGTHYIVRFYPPFGVSILYKNLILLGLTTKKSLLTWVIFLTPHVIC